MSLLEPKTTNIENTQPPSKTLRDPRDYKGPRKSFTRPPKVQSEFKEKVILIRKINRIATGGRILRFSAAVAIGNGKGVVGFGIAKANEVPDAIKKAIDDAHKHLTTIAITKTNNSIFHEIIGTYCASKILLKPAKEGIGIKAGGAARDILELAGIHNIYSKSLGSNNKINLARATIKGLAAIKAAEYFLANNDKKIFPNKRINS